MAVVRGRDGKKLNRIQGRETESADRQAYRRSGSSTHKLARLVYRMLKFGQEYVDKGAEHYETRYRQHQMKWLMKQAAL